MTDNDMNPSSSAVTAPGSETTTRSTTTVSSTTSARTPLITSSFRDRMAAERAYADLQKRGYTEKDIHVMMSDDTRKKYFGHDVVIDHSNKALAGAGVGGVVGGAVGATLIGILAASAAVALPGIGLVIAGPLAGVLAGGAAGAAAGGLVGTLVGAGMPEDKAKIYEKDLHDGSIVIGVKTRHDDDARYFENEWRTSGYNVNR